MCGPFWVDIVGGVGCGGVEAVLGNCGRLMERPVLLGAPVPNSASPGGEKLMRRDTTPVLRKQVQDWGCLHTAHFHRSGHRSGHQSGRQWDSNIQPV